jgi:signal transduction histidine kinase
VLRPRRHLLAFVATLVVAGGCARVPADVQTFFEASRLLVASPNPPAADATGWEPVQLPDYWDAELRRRSVQGWYRVTVDLTAPPTEIWAVYLPRVGQTAGVWVNGVHLGGGDVVDPLPRDWVNSLFFTVPAELLHPGANDVVVRVLTHIGAPGYLRGIDVGPERSLRPVFDRILGLQLGLTQMIAAATLTMGLLILLVSIGRPELRDSIWLAIGLVVWSWGSADVFFKRIFLPTRLWEWTVGIAPLWAVVCFGLGFHRVLSIVRPRHEAVLVAIASFVSAGILIAPPVYGFAGTVTAGGLAVFLALYLVTLLARIQQGEDDMFRRRFIVPTAIGICFGLHDVAVIVLHHPLLGVFVSPYIPAVVLLTMGWALLARMVDSHTETLVLNRELEHRVAEKGRELEHNYARLAALERDRAVAEERARLMRDVHDGVGGQLVSTLALVEAGEPDDDTIAESIRGALEDLRLVIDSLEPTEDDLPSVLGSVRSRLEPRLARHGLRFAWQVTDLPAVPGFGPEMALQAMRVVQEAVTNVVKHAGARTVTVRTGEAPDDDGRRGVFVEVVDDGRGIAADAPRGRGLANMARRAGRIGGLVRVRSDRTGTVVRLWLPCEPDGAQSSSFTRPRASAS